MRWRAGVRVVVSMCAVAASLAPLIATTDTAAADAATCSARSPLPPGLANELAFRYPGRRFSVGVSDSSGCSYTLNPDLRIGAASVVKMEFMAGVLLLAQNEGRGLTQWEQDRLWPMITRSDNTSASQLWQYLGQDAGMQQIDAAFGLTQTQHSGAVWGLTTTSVIDQLRLVSELIPGLGGPLNAASRLYAKYYMTNVIPEQRWGASSGVPAGWTVSQKNGFAGSQCCNWRINSVGWIERPGGSGWGIAVLSDGWSTEQEGINAVQELSGRINGALVDPYFIGPGAVFTGTNRVDVFVRGASGSLRERAWTATGGFGGWIDVGGYAMSDPDAVSGGATLMPGVFVVGTDSALYEGFWTQQGYGFASLGGICTSGPSAVFSGRNRLDAFCRGTDNQLWTRTWKNTTGWGNWSSLGGQITSDPDAASPGDASQLVVVARGTDNAVWQYFLQGGQWLVQSLGGICTSGPSAVYSGAGREDVFCRGTDGQPWNRTWKSDTGWNGWSPIGGLAASDLDAVSQGDGFTPQVFARGTDGAVWQWLFSQNSWRVQSWGQP